MSGAVEICKRYAEMSSKREAAERAAGNEEGAAFESGSTITAMNLADMIARTTPPARSYADGVSGEALFRAFMASDVTRLTTTALPEEWPHMMPSYRAAWDDLAIRLLSQGGNA